ncbi:hypothetical protein F4781DRAFT_421016 [Annulohypoxylon bovei var. microspora]|nr:hypothetical protein F4781DRAFT_421016 [Annulohypoxylon bovei var. microspora]
MRAFLLSIYHVFPPEPISILFLTFLIPAFGAQEQSDAEKRTTSAMNVVDPTSTHEPLSITIPRKLKVELEKSRRISRGEWEKHRKVIETQYSSKTLAELREFMATEHNFIASTQQWKKKLSEWHLGKNLRPHLTKFIRKRAYGRQENEKKATQFSLGGQLIPMDKIKRHLQDPPDNPSSPTGSTPTGISYHTYKSPILVRHQEIYQMPTSPASSLAFWQGHDADYFLATARTAISLVKSNDYPKAKLAFMEALEGIGILRSPVHVQTISVLENFTRAALRNDDTPTALEKLHKSHNAHRDLLGIRDKRTWRSLARLGCAYKDANNINQAYHMLLNARQGLLANAVESDQESIFLSTRKLSWHIIDILKRQLDFDEAEKELLSSISKAEGLGESYQSYLIIQKLDLAKLYMNEYTRKPTGSEVNLLQKMESLTLEVMRLYDTSNKQRWYFDRALPLLCASYGYTKEYTKLQELLSLINQELADTSCLDIIPRGWSFNLQRQVILTLLRLGRYDEAGAWFVRLQGEIEKAPRFGAQWKQEICRATLNEVRAIARRVLPKDHKFHAFLEVAVKDGVFLWTPCPICLGKRSPEKTFFGCCVGT